MARRRNRQNERHQPLGEEPNQTVLDEDVGEREVCGEELRIFGGARGRPLAAQAIAQRFQEITASHCWKMSPAWARACAAKPAISNAAVPKASRRPNGSRRAARAVRRAQIASRVAVSPTLSRGPRSCGPDGQRRLHGEDAVDHAGAIPARQDQGDDEEMIDDQAQGERQDERARNGPYGEPGGPQGEIARQKGDLHDRHQAEPKHRRPETGECGTLNLHKPT